MRSGYYLGAGLQSRTARWISATKESVLDAIGPGDLERFREEVRLLEIHQAEYRSLRFGGAGLIAAAKPSNQGIGYAAESIVLRAVRFRNMNGVTNRSDKRRGGKLKSPYVPVAQLDRAAVS